MSHFSRVVGIDPTTRGFSYAVLEGRDNLIDWGLCHLLVRTDSAVLSRVGQVLQRYNPDVLVVEDGRGTKRRARACRLIHGIEAIAKRQNIPLVRVSRSAIRRTLAPAQTKQEIAEAVARYFPELASRLPRPRKPWMTEDERMNIFDAVSLVLGAPWQ